MVISGFWKNVYGAFCSRERLPPPQCGRGRGEGVVRLPCGRGVLPHLPEQHLSPYPAGKRAEEPAYGAFGIKLDGRRGILGSVCLDQKQELLETGSGYSRSFTNGACVKRASSWGWPSWDGKNDKKYYPRRNGRCVLHPVCRSLAQGKRTGGEAALDRKGIYRAQTRRRAEQAFHTLREQ